MVTIEEILTIAIVGSIIAIVESIIAIVVILLSTVHRVQCPPVDQWRVY